MEDKKIEIVEINAANEIKTKLRVAAYARVSSDSDDQMNSFVSQVRYYRNMIEKNSEWEMVDIYADEGITGVSIKKRTDFKRMLDDCRKGKIDRIITKSTSRFARNTMDTLKTIRELRAIGVTVYFEKERMDTKNLTNETLLTLYSMFAQEESLNISKNCKKGIRMKMSNGTFISYNVPYGYRLVDRKLVINYDEAEIVKKIFSDYLDGKGIIEIADNLSIKNIKTPKGTDKWSYQTIARILKNEYYIGDKLFLKSYREDAIPYKKRINNGELPKYYVKHSHEPVIDVEAFKKVGALMDGRTKNMNIQPIESPLNQMIRCRYCGKTFRKKTIRGKRYWKCNNLDADKSNCESESILEENILNAFVNMYNKLRLTYQDILYPMLALIEKAENIDAKRNIKFSKINKQIGLVLEKIQAITKLQSKGVLDSSLFLTQKNELEKELRGLKTEKAIIAANNDEDKTYTETKNLIEILEDGPPKIDSFDSELFKDIVEIIYASDKKSIDFKLINGLILTERL